MRVKKSQSSNKPNARHSSSDSNKYTENVPAEASPLSNETYIVQKKDDNRRASFYNPSGRELNLSDGSDTEESIEFDVVEQPRGKATPKQAKTATNSESFKNTKPMETLTDENSDVMKTKNTGRNGSRKKNAVVESENELDKGDVDEELDQIPQQPAKKVRGGKKAEEKDEVNDLKNVASPDTAVKSKRGAATKNVKESGELHKGEHEIQEDEQIPAPTKKGSAKRGRPRKEKNPEPIAEEPKGRVERGKKVSASQQGKHKEEQIIDELEQQLIDTDTKTNHPGSVYSPVDDRTTKKKGKKGDKGSIAVDVAAIIVNEVDANLDVSVNENDYDEESLEDEVFETPKKADKKGKGAAKEKAKADKDTIQSVSQTTEKSKRGKLASKTAAKVDTETTVLPPIREEQQPAEEEENQKEKAGERPIRKGKTTPAKMVKKNITKAVSVEGDGEAEHEMPAEPTEIGGKKGKRKNVPGALKETEKKGALEVDAKKENDDEPVAKKEREAPKDRDRKNNEENVDVDDDETAAPKEKKVGRGKKAVAHTETKPEVNTDKDVDEDAPAHKEKKTGRGKKVVANANAEEKDTEDGVDEDKIEEKEQRGRRANKRINYNEATSTSVGPSKKTRKGKKNTDE